MVTALGTDSTACAAMEYKAAIRTTIDKRKVISPFGGDAESSDTLADYGSPPANFSGNCAVCAVLSAAMGARYGSKLRLSESADTAPQGLDSAGVHVESMREAVIAAAIFAVSGPRSFS